MRENRHMNLLFERLANAVGNETQLRPHIEMQDDHPMTTSRIKNAKRGLNAPGFFFRRLRASKMQCAAPQKETSISVRLTSSAFANAAAPASPMLL